MKAITLWQPWASLVAAEVKRRETRSWKTSYRGPIAIHAAKFMPTDLNPEWRRMAGERLQSSLQDLPRGAVVAVAHLSEIYKTEHIPREQRDPWGDYGPGRYAWYLNCIESIEPIPARGHQGLWNWEGRP